MEEEIIRKLDEFLTEHNPLTEECHVVYLLVEIRKLIDNLNLRNRFAILRFYCNWTVHAKKDRDNEAIIDIVQKIEKSIAEGQTFPEEKMHIPEGNIVFEFMGLEQLKREMIDFFSDFGLCDSIFQAKGWFSFKNHLIRVLVNQPLVLSNRDITSISFEPAIEGAEHIIIEYRGEKYRFLNYRGTPR